MFKVTETICKSALNPSRIPGVNYCLNPYRGCSHSCVYCYAGCLNRFSGREEEWGSFVEVKINFIGRLATQLKRPKQGTVMLSSVTDPYQEIDAEYGLTRQCLKLLVGTELKVSILTKSDLVLRDVDILEALPGAEVGFTLTTVDDRLARLLEPGAPLPSRRLAALEKLARATVKTWVFVAPVLPGLTDTPESIRNLRKAVNQTGTREIHFDPFNFYPRAVARIKELIAQNWPHQKPVFARACRDPTTYRQHVGRLMYNLLK